jgi:hypothetical protein
MSSPLFDRIRAGVNRYRQEQTRFGQAAQGIYGRSKKEAHNLSEREVTGDIMTLEKVLLWEEEWLGWFRNAYYQLNETTELPDDIKWRAINRIREEIGTLTQTIPVIRGDINRRVKVRYRSDFSEPPW